LPFSPTINILRNEENFGGKAKLFKRKILTNLQAIEKLNPVLFGTFTWGNLTGIEGIIVGFSAIYLAITEVLNEVHGKTIRPILSVKK
jgi:hypothetical protein